MTAIANQPSRSVSPAPTPWHAQSAAQVAAALGVDPERGLTAQQVEASRSRFGFNELPPPKDKPTWLLFLEQSNNPIIYVLLGAAILKIFLGKYDGAGAIAFVIVFNSVLGFIQENKAQKAIKSLQTFVSATARVLRDGQKQDIPAREVTPGDILLLESGMRVPADARLLETRDLTADESMLTGESLASEKNDAAVQPPDAPLGDRVNLVFSGTTIQRGRGKAVAVAIGPGTELGTISTSLANTETAKSPLQERLERFGKRLTVAILVVIAIIFTLGLLRGNDLVQMLLTAIGLAVSAIPEGLPIAVTVTLSFGLVAMARRKAVIRRLAAVETLGSCNVICSDKTGTLTENQMTAVRLFSGDRVFEVTGGGYSAMGEVRAAWNSQRADTDMLSALEWPLRISALCTESTLARRDEHFEITGDPTEAALMILAHKAGVLDQQGWRVEVDLPFESERQFMAVTASRGDEHAALFKGSVERLLPRCTHMLDERGQAVQIVPHRVLEQVERFSEQGLRVIALAFTSGPNRESPEFLATGEGLIFAGLAALQDPPREAAHKAVLACRSAGIKVVMITGDHVKTAKAIAGQLELHGGDVPRTLTGAELDQMDDDALFQRAPEVDVYARVSPIHKLRIVRALQAHGNVVAMTGDGVNDAPSLKQANIGVAMGAGADVTKEVASMVILDNNFATIVEAVRRGRVIYDNLQQIILYLITTCLSGVLTVAASVIIGFRLPLFPLQLLWINIVTDGTHTIPLALEKEHGDAMKNKPRRKSEPLITGVMLSRTLLCALTMMLGTLAVFFWALNVRGAGAIEQAAAQAGITLTPHHLSELLRDADRFLENAASHGFTAEALAPVAAAANQQYILAVSIAFCTLAFFQIFNAQNSRSIRSSLFFRLPVRGAPGRVLERVRFSDNVPLLLVMVGAAFLQILAVEGEFLHAFLETTPLAYADWALVIGVSLTVILVAEGHKFWLACVRGQG